MSNIFEVRTYEIQPFGLKDAEKQLMVMAEDQYGREVIIFDDEEDLKSNFKTNLDLMKHLLSLEAFDGCYSFNSEDELVYESISGLIIETPLEKNVVIAD